MKLKESIKGSAVILVSITAIILGTYSSFNKQISLTIDGQTSKIDTISRTVEELLSSRRIILREGSRLQPSLDSKIKDKMEIKIINQFEIKVVDSGVEKSYKTNQENVEDALESLNIVLGDKDIVNKDLDEKLDKNEKIKITRVKEEDLIEVEEIPFETEVKKDAKLVKGKQILQMQGQKGEKKITYKITYNDNKIVSKKKILEEITKKPINEVIKKGTLETDTI